MTIDHSKSLLNDNETLCIEIDRESQLIVDVHPSVIKINFGKRVRTSVQYAMLTDVMKQNLKILKCDPICQACCPRSVVKQEKINLQKVYLKQRIIEMKQNNTESPANTERVRQN